MRLHLPKGLLAALLAACYALPSEAATTVTVGTYTDSTFDSVTPVTEVAGFPGSASETNDAIWVSGTRIEVNKAASVNLNNADVVIVGSGTYQADGAESATSITTGQLFLQGWEQNEDVDITTKLILGSVSSDGNYKGSALRFGANGTSGKKVKVSGDIELGNDALITATGAHAVISGNITGVGKTLTISKFSGTGDGVAKVLLEGKTDAEINLGGLTVSGSEISVEMNYGSATVGNLTLSGTAFTNSGSLTIGGEGKTLTLGTVLGGDGTVEIKDSTTVNISDVVLRPLFSGGEEEKYNDTQNNGFSRFSSTTARLSDIITTSNLTLGNDIVWKYGTDEITYSDGVLSGLYVETTKYYIVNESVTWSEASGATALWVAENLTVTGGSEVPTTVGTFNLGAGSTLSMDSLSGTKTVNGEGKLSVSSLSGEVTINGTGNVAVGTLSDSTTISGSAHIDITGNINLSGKSLTLKNNADGAMVTLYGTNDLQMIDLKSGNITAHMTLAAGSTTTLSASRDETHGLWMHTASTLDILKEERDGSGNLIKAGGKLSFGSGTAGATISATDQDASISATTGAHFAFNSTAFTLTNVEFRANSSAAAINLTNKLVNAIVVNDSSNVLTVNNAANTLRGVEAAGGNIKFAANAEVTGSIKIADGKSVVVNSGAALTHDGFTYDGSTIKTSNAGSALSLWNNAVVNGGTLTQKENADVGHKIIGSTLTDVKLVNTSGLELHLESAASLSAVDIGGKLQVGANTTVSGASTVSGTVEVLAGKSLQMSGGANITGTADVKGTLSTGANSSIATLTGSGSLKVSGDTGVTNASGFSGSLQTGATLQINSGVKGLKALKINSGGQVWAYTGTDEGSNAITSVKIEEVVLDGGLAGIYINGSASNATVQTDSLVVSAASTLFADLTLSDNAGLVVNVGGVTADTATAICSLNGALTLGSELSLTLSNLGKFKAGDSIKLFSGVTSVTYTIPTTGVETDIAALSEDVGTTGTLDATGIDASQVFSNVAADTYTLKFDNNIVSLVAQRDVPEPTTATLSLLALMGLAARRRRRKA